jgi:hypothetical protein
LLVSLQSTQLPGLSHTFSENLGTLKHISKAKLSGRPEPNPSFFFVSKAPRNLVRCARGSPILFTPRSPVLQILFLDDDIVVQRDLTRLWEEDLEGNVNGAVETCGASFHRFDKYLNFSNPKIRDNFDPRACGWAYGMNVFDLKAWKEKDITGIYHRWQSQVRRAGVSFLLLLHVVRFLAASKMRKFPWHSVGATVRTLGRHLVALSSSYRLCSVLHSRGME